MIDAERCREIIAGSAPETPAEEMFLFCFEGAAQGTDLGDLVEEMGDMYDDAGAHELEMTLAGYATGQRQRNLDLKIVDNNIH